MAKIGRNQPCPCGSGLKYKRCHGRSDGVPAPFDVRGMLGAHAADERIRETQQGLGRPIIAAKVKDHQVVAVGNTIHWSKAWKTFPDFLADYIKRKVGPEWGNAEISKPLAERHPLMQWYDACCRYQERTIETPGEVHSADVTGVVACYLGVAYALYLLDHNSELQARLINRLKNPGNFQGAYYELIVASILIRAGFMLTLEDETNPAAKHCEFAAVSKTTGKRYWVEAKMRSVNGLLGRTAADGGPDGKLLSRLIPHLNDALKKPAKDERLIFIDLNTPPAIGADGKPDWLEPAMARLERYERMVLKARLTAYVFITNMAFHRQLDAAPSFAACPFGLGMPDFNRPGMIRISDAYRQKQKHIDAHAIGQSIDHYLRFPATFDGRLPSESFGRSTSRVVIGETYFFADVGEGGITGTVTAACVDEGKKEAVIGITDGAGRSQTLRLPMSDADLAEYAEFSDAYFGRLLPGPTKPKDNFELFEWFMATHKTMPRAKMLAWFSAAPDLAELEKLSDEDLRIAYCEALVAAVEAKTSKP
jgi:hypothetical protein